jgi:hypothetical protein
LRAIVSARVSGNVKEAPFWFTEVWAGCRSLRVAEVLIRLLCLRITLDMQEESGFAMKNCSRIGNAVGSTAVASSHTRGGGWAGLLSKRACSLGAALAAALIAPMAGADLTITLTNRTLTNRGSFLVPSVRGTWTGAKAENITVTGGQAYTADITLVLVNGQSAPTDPPKIATAQIGSTVVDYTSANPDNGNTWVRWGPESTAPLTAEVAFASTSYDFTANPNYSLWVAHGYFTTDRYSGTLIVRGVTGPAYYPDADGDGYGDSTATPFYPTAGTSNGTDAFTYTGVTGKVANNSDCNDSDAAIKPFGVENCANLAVDNDCDGVNNAAEAVDSTNYYADADNDSYTTNTATKFCTAPGSGYEASAEGDCNDSNAAINPGATEVCDVGNVDENCNGFADNADSGAADAGKTNFYRDQDSDTYTTNTASRFCDMPAGYEAAAEGDCNDLSNAVYPGAVENCANDGVDNDCDGEANADSEAVNSVNYYVDADTDTYGSSVATAVKSCTAISGSVTNNTDCNDANNAINPAATEICDAGNVDENCNGVADNADSGAAAGSKTTFYVDADGDTHTTSATGAFCDLPSGYRVALSSPVDCNDSNAAIYPGAVENCANDGVDNDCDNEATADSEAIDSVNYYVDADTDNYGSSAATAVKSCTAVSGSVTNNTDCNDANNAINPAATEICDAGNVDENCNGLADNADSGAAVGSKTMFYVDADGDTHTTSATGAFCDLPSGYRATLSSPVDCNDSNAAIYPNAVENCANDGVDNDCDNEATADSEAIDSVNYYVDADTDNYGSSAATAVKSCTAISGSVTNNTDCNDANNAINPAATEICDAGNVDENCNGVADNADSGAAVGSKTTFYVDADGDTHTTSATGAFCDLPSGYRVTLSSPVDCNDSNAAIYPGAVENCANDGVDNDCDGEANADSEAVNSVNYYVDADTDTYGSSAATAVKSCTAISGSVTNNTDCNDANNAINPAATEICDAGNVDENCNGVADNADPGAASGGKTTFYVDADGDTHTTSATGAFCDLPSGYRVALSSPVDCNDSNAAIYPGAVENCANDGVDNDCDGEANADSEAVNSVNYYVDADTDTYGSSAATAVKSCTAISGSVTNNTDCNDANNAINPAATEICDAGNVDENCNGLADNADSGAAAGSKTTFYVDADGDTHTTSATGAFCDLPSGYRVTLSSPVDCNDSNAAIYPNAVENCANDGVDNDCDNEATADSEAIDSVNYYVDADTDTYGSSAATAVKSCTSISGSVTNNTDCNDANNAINPGATEICDAGNVDENCNGVADNADSGAAVGSKTTFYVDADGDTHTTSATGAFCDLPSGYRVALSSPVDCNDSNAAIYPNAVENCANDGVDNDCDNEATADSEAIDSVNYYVDADTDTYGSSVATAVKSCTAISGSVTNNTDCNDANNAINPAATEICDAGNVDENCNGFADNADSGADDAGKTNFYRDQDSDTFTTNTASRFCDLPAGYEAAAEGDCNDTNNAIYPTAIETCANLGVDNDCDTINTEAEATDRNTYYLDMDGDSAGDPTVSTLACSTPTGYVSTSNDLCPANNALTSPVTYYADADGDGAGNPSSTTSVCSTTPPTGYVANSNDQCPSDAAKTAPGVCGCGVADTDTDSDGTADCIDSCPNDPNKIAPGACGCGLVDTDANSDGTADCLQQTSVITLTPSADTTLIAGETLTVRASVSAIGLYSTGVQLAIHFNPNDLMLVSATPVSNGAFRNEVLETIDNTRGTLMYTLGLAAGASATTGPAQLADLTFQVRSGADACNESGSVYSAAISSYYTRIFTVIGHPVLPSVSALPAVTFDGLDPVFTGVPSSTTIAADARSTFGGTVVNPAVTANDNCSGNLAVDIDITYPDTTTATAWPLDNLFPIGTTSVTWTAEDALGNISTETRQITVSNHQLLDVQVGFVGAIAANTPRSIRVRAGSSIQVLPVTLTGSSASITGVQLPVALDYPCVTAKAVSHSIADAMSTSIVSRRYSATASLLQGDSNDDDMVDITDFALYVANRGSGKAVDAISNFNGDTVINTVDFTFIGVNFFRVGETCGSFDGVIPRDRISVRELRRTGLGELIQADLNGDGWVDLDDMQHYMQGAGQ